MKYYCNDCGGYNGRNSKCDRRWSPYYGEHVDPYDTCDYADGYGQNDSRSDRDYGDEICENCISFDRPNQCYCTGVWTRATNTCPNFRSKW